MKILSVIFICVLACAVSGAELPKRFLNALHQVETGGRTGAIKGDNGKALGPFQIHESYWIDSGVKGSYNQCVDYDYSVKVVTAYLNRYGASHIEKRDWQSLARIHNGGPNGAYKKATLPYWEKVRKHL